MTAKDEFETIPAAEALELYLDERERDGSPPTTLRSHRSRLEHFVEWFEDESGQDELHELTGLDIRRWKEWRFDDHSIHTVSTQMDTLRVFVRFLGDIGAVSEALPEKIKSPNRPNGQRSNEIPAERAKTILSYLDRYAYSSTNHVIAHLLWYSMMRVGSLRSIDLADVDLKGGYIELEHQPEQGTPLKNRESSERVIKIRPTTVEILRDYISEHRTDKTDEYGREPLVTLPRGSARPHVNSIRNRVYGLTRPCRHGEACPDDRDLEDCRAATNINKACECPDSESTHAFRRGSISWHLRSETRKEVVSDRADVSTDVIDENYSTLSEREKADVRASELPGKLGDR
jgi:integrase